MHIATYFGVNIFITYNRNLIMHSTQSQWSIVNLGCTYVCISSSHLDKLCYDLLMCYISICCLLV